MERERCRLSLNGSQTRSAAFDKHPIGRRQAENSDRRVEVLFFKTKLLFTFYNVH